MQTKIENKNKNENKNLKSKNKNKNNQRALMSQLIHALSHEVT